MRAQRRRAAPGVVRAAAPAHARAGQRRLVRGHQGPHGEDRGRRAEQVVSIMLLSLSPVHERLWVDVGESGIDAGAYRCDVCFMSSSSG